MLRGLTDRCGFGPVQRLPQVIVSFSPTPGGCRNDRPLVSPPSAWNQPDRGLHRAHRGQPSFNRGGAAAAQQGPPRQRQHQNPRRPRHPGPSTWPGAKPNRRARPEQRSGACVKPLTSTASISPHPHHHDDSPPPLPTQPVTRAPETTSRRTTSPRFNLYR